MVNREYYTYEELKELKVCFEGMDLLGTPFKQFVSLNFVHDYFGHFEKAYEKVNNLYYNVLPIGMFDKDTFRTFLVPYEDLPLYVSSDLDYERVVVAWRLKLGK